MLTNIKSTCPTISLTLEPARIIIICQGHAPRIYTSDRKRRLWVAYAVRRGWRRSNTQIGIIYRNWL